MQQSWAYAHNVNLLAAGISTPEDGYSGSGIYSGHSGALSAVISDTPLTKLLVAYVPKVPGTILPKTISAKDKSPKHHGVASNPAMIFSKENLPDLDFLMLNFTQSNRQEGKICKNDFCCHYAIEVFTHKLPANAVRVHFTGRLHALECRLRLKLENLFENENLSFQSFYSYAVGVHNGMISFKPYSNAVIYGTMCSLVACSNEFTCEFKYSTHINIYYYCNFHLALYKLHRFSFLCQYSFTNSRIRFEKYVFKRLHLYGKFPSNRIVRSAPNTLTTSLMPLQKDDFDYSESADYVVTETYALFNFLLAWKITTLSHTHTNT